MASSPLTAREWVDLWERGRAARADTSDRLETLVDEALGERNLASHESVAALDARISRLEAIVERRSLPVRQP